MGSADIAGQSLMTRSKSNGPTNNQPSTIRQLQARMNKTPAPRKPMTASHLVMADEALNSTMPLTTTEPNIAAAKQRENSSLFNDLNRSYIETLARGSFHP